MTPRYLRGVEQALALVGFSEGDLKPRLNRLYADARNEWLTRNGLSTDLHALLNALLHEKAEVTVEDDAQLRLAYGIRGAA